MKKLGAFVVKGLSHYRLIELSSFPQYSWAKFQWGFYHSFLGFISGQLQPCYTLQAPVLFSIGEFSQPSYFSSRLERNRKRTDESRSTAQNAVDRKSEPWVPAPFLKGKRLFTFFQVGPNLEREILLDECQYLQKDKTQKII